MGWQWFLKDQIPFNKYSITNHKKFSFVLLSFVWEILKILHAKATVLACTWEVEGKYLLLRTPCTLDIGYLGPSAGIDSYSSSYKSGFYSTRRYNASFQNNQQFYVAVIPMNQNNDHYDTITLRVQQWYAYLGSNQQLSNWT